MKSDDIIEKLLEDEDIPELPPASEGLRKFELKPSAEALAQEKNPKPRPSVEELREFTRAEIGSKEILMNFTSAAGFARHYVENISLGGMFVRTTERPGVGAKIPIDFSVPLPNSETKEFRLYAKVCRETNTGLGLQFVDFDDEARSDLEAFVKTVIPEGVPLVNRVKQSAVDRLEQMRDEKAEASSKQARWMIRVAVVIALLCVNVYLAHESVVDQQTYVVQPGEIPSVTLKGERVPLDSIRSIRRLADGQISIRIKGGNEIVMKATELRSVPLPLALRSAVNTATQKAPLKVRRHTMNSRRRGRP